MTREHLEKLIKEMEHELETIKTFNQESKTIHGYALSGRALTFRKVIRPLKGIDDLYGRLEDVTTGATALI